MAVATSVGRRVERGDVRWYRFAPPDKRRPVLIVTRSAAIGYLNAVTVAPITTTFRGVPSEVRLSADDGLVRDCAANCHNLQTVPKANLGGFVASLSRPRMAEVDRAILFALGLA
ncbi:MAG: type II toxin-antitoxin system PemK/MazF family toxin [Candidatus Promineifilaceae bacterium]